MKNLSHRHVIAMTKACLLDHTAQNPNPCRHPQQGEQVLVRGSVSLYEARGDFQLIVEHMEAIGEGALQRKFEQIKKQLLKAGLFEQKHKMQLPAYPCSASIRDVLHVFNRRYPAASIMGKSIWLIHALVGVWIGAVKEGSDVAAFIPLRVENLSIITENTAQLFVS